MDQHADHAGIGSCFVLSNPEEIHNRSKKQRLSSGSSSSSPSHRRGISLDSIIVLQTWLDSHLSNPYPTREEKEELAKATSLTVKQVSTWFSNTRKRQLNPMEKWLSSGSEDEAASTIDIFRAAEREQAVHDQPYRLLRRDTGGSSAGSIVSSASSAFSQCSDARLYGPHRRGKRKHMSAYHNEGTCSQQKIRY
jgi:hypothetical protein